MEFIMKKFLTLLIFVVSISSLQAQLIKQQGASQAQYPYQKAVSIDPIDFLVSKVFNATYEHKLSPANSFTVFVSYYDYSDYWSAFGIGASYRWYLRDIIQDNETPIGGLSVGPMARISFWDYTGPNPLRLDYDGSLFVIGAEAAYKFTFDNWYIEPILRLGFAVSKLDNLGYDPMGGGINFGYAW